MKKLALNKTAVSQMERGEMAEINGGFKVCLGSCPSGTRKGKSCCDGGTWGIDITLYKD